MSIGEIYRHYRIMPGLQQHMLRVAAVATVIIDHFHEKLPRKAIITACLLHDMGNIIKFKLGLLPELLEPEGLEYWHKVQNEFTTKYGQDEHEATYVIAEEIGVSGRIMELVKAVGFNQSPQNAQHNDFAKKICAYCDHRVSPTGVLALEKRMQEGRKRFVLNKGKKEDIQEFERLAGGMRELERQIFSKCDISPDFITDETIAKPMAKLEREQLEISFLD